MIRLSMGAITAMIKEDSILTQTFDQASVLDGVFQTTTRKRGEIRVCQRFLRECMFILSVTVGLNLISVGWVCSAVRVFSHRHTRWCPCEVPKADRLAVTSAPYLEITQMKYSAHFGHFIQILIKLSVTRHSYRPSFYCQIVPGIFKTILLNIICPCKRKFHIHELEPHK